MPNENHEVYNGNNVATYTDDITTSNSFTEEEIMGYVLSAGVTPNSDTLYVQTGAFSHESATGGPNSVSPFYKESDSSILWYDDSGLGVMSSDNLYRYKHCVFVSTSGNKVASSLKVEHYKIFLSIREKTDSTIDGKTIKWYLPEPTLKYGIEGDWTVSALQPAFLYRNTNNIVGAQSVAALITQCNWYWGGANNVQNFLNGWNMFDRNLQYGTDMGGHEYVPWERPGTDPIRIKEGGGDATFPTWFENSHFLWAFYGNNPLRLFCGYNNIDDILLITAFCGLKFEYNGITYKPIVNGGIVTGYTSDMSKTSEWDDWRDIGDHTIPVAPPTPTPSPTGDDMESQKLGATGSSGGFTKYFVMSPQNLSDFLTDFYSRADAGETLSDNLVCSYILGVPFSNWGASENVPITIHNSAQGTPFVSQANYKHVTGTNNYIVAGSFQVPRMTNTFYDFAPYSTYELFIPCCGWITLPDTVAGRYIRVSIQLDIATCGAKGIVKFDDGSTCAVCSGIIGSSIPMAIIESGLLRGANVQAASSALGGALMAGAGFGNGNAGFGLGGIGQVVSSFAQSAIAGNTNYTNQKGSSGDITQFAMGHNCYIKITYPPIDEVVNNSMFGHTVGYLCEEVGQLSNFHGFTVCANPHIQISATSAEKEEIKQLLEQGVILP